MNKTTSVVLTCWQLCPLLPIKNKPFPALNKLAEQDVRVFNESEQYYS